LAIGNNFLYFIDIYKFNLFLRSFVTFPVTVSRFKWACQQILNLPLFVVNVCVLDVANFYLLFRGGGV